MRVLLNSILGLSLWALCGGALAVAAIGPVPQSFHTVDIDSGLMANTQSTDQVVFSQEIDLGNVPWVRVFFESVNLEEGSFLRITSHQDGDVQVLDRKTVAEWNNSTAYFNGPAVTVELIAAPRTTTNHVSIKQVLAGDGGPQTGPAFFEDGIQRVCAPVDTRVASSHAATARFLIGGLCSAFMIDRGPIGNPNDRCFLSAGHCFPGTAGVVQFDVPASNTDCTLNHPPAAKQFVVNDDTVQFVNGGAGNDWSLFRVFANANTGKTSFQEQGAHHPLAAAVAAGPATKYGTGVDGDPVGADGSDIHCICRSGDAEAPKNATQQTSSGTISMVVGDLVLHDLHDCGGDSGEVIVNASGEVVAIGTHGGCDDETPTNAGTAITHAGLQDAIATFCQVEVPVISVPGDITFDNICVDGTGEATLNVCNLGKADLEVSDITSSDPQFEVVEPSSGYIVVISPDFCFPFRVLFTPTALGPQSGTLTIFSNDPVRPELEVDVTGDGGEPRIATLIANNGSFGDVCLGEFKDLDLTINNSGDCSLSVLGITSSNPADFEVPGVMSYPLVIGPGDSLQIPIRYHPNALTAGPVLATFTIETNDPNTPFKPVQVTANTPPGDIAISGSPDFGDVCTGTLAEKRISVCNVGPCNLTVTNATIDCTDFTLINRWFPATVSPDFCMDLIVRFTPTSGGPKVCTLTIETDDPDEPTRTQILTANTPIPSIDVPGDQAFPATVVQTVGACRESLPFPVSNTGICDLNITNYSISQNWLDYAISGLPSFPIILGPGHIAGAGNLTLDFKPALTLDRDLEGKVAVTYVDDPILGTTTTVERNLCGEGVYTGARVLVRQNVGGVYVPVQLVDKIQLQRINANRNRNRLDTVNVTRDVMPTSVTPNAPCLPFSYHVEWGTMANPVQLLPGAYQVTVTVRLGGTGKPTTKVVGFDVTTCGFNPTVYVDFD